MKTTSSDIDTAGRAINLVIPHLLAESKPVFQPYYFEPATRYDNTMSGQQKVSILACSDSAQDSGLPALKEKLELFGISSKIIEKHDDTDAQTRLLVDTDDVNFSSKMHALMHYYRQQIAQDRQLELDRIHKKFLPIKHFSPAAFTHDAGNAGQHAEVSQLYK